MSLVPLLILIASLFAAQPSWASQPDFHLQVVPAVVYKVDDPGNTATSSFVFDVVVICSNDCALTPISASVELLNGRTTVERQNWTTEMLAKIKGVNYRILPDTPIASDRRLFTLPEAFDVHFYFRRPQALAIDSADVRLEVADSKGRRTEQRLKIPVQYYQQKTSLIFPFRGHAIVGQDWATNGGHGSGYGSDFAIDVYALDENDATQKSDANENAAATGWGREILAPAAGTVVYTRNDVPDNPHPGAPDISQYAALHDPALASYGNCVIIDHGNSEYSLMAHLQQGSVRVNVGERVGAGQVIGRLGNSGNSFGPHLHFQLQSGPQLVRDESLPFKFQNIHVPQLSRGRYFEAK